MRGKACPATIFFACASNCRNLLASPDTPDGYFNTPEGPNVVVFKGPNGEDLNDEEWHAYLVEKEKRLAREGRPDPSEAPPEPRA